MNNPSPLIPQGSILEQKNKSRARVRLAVFFVLSIHIIGLMALLMQGCRKPEPSPTPSESTTPTPPSTEASNLPPVEATAPPAAVPPATEISPPAAPPATQEYVVARGDTFYSIAKKFGTTMRAIQDANPNVQPTKLQPGQKLQIPTSAASPATATGAAPGGVATGPGGEQVYTVKSGDTLTGIANEFHTTVKALRSENNLITDKIKVGQKLKIPAGAAAPATEPAAPAAPAAPTPAPAGNPTT
jgi:LysM repeat protein